MCELSSNYDPIALHAEIEEIYKSPDMVAHARLMRSISQAARQGRYVRRPVETIIRPDLFGEYGGDPGTISRPPISNKE